MKKCSTCGEYKDEFCRSKKTNDGFHYQCKACMSKAKKEHRERKKAGLTRTNERLGSWDPRPSDIVGARKIGDRWFITFDELVEVPDIFDQNPQ